MVEIKKGDVFLADLEPVRGSEQGGIRPVLIIQNNISNKYSLVTIIATITSSQFEKKFPINIKLLKQDSNLDKDSTILLNQIRTIDKSRLIKKMSTLSYEIMNKINLAIQISFGL